MHYDRPAVLSVAGYDPSGGAGILADIKTLEQHRCLGLGVLTALTVQTENRFLGLDWLPFGKITEQLQPLFQQYPIKVVKIGIIENLEILIQLISTLKEWQEDCKIIWDPVIASSTGFTFHNHIDRKLLAEILGNIYLVTPNVPEACKLSGSSDSTAAAQCLASMANVLLKGGHNEQQKGTDYLWENGQVTSFNSEHHHNSEKHGSGCILSAAIAAGLAYGYNLQQACTSAKSYIEKILNSNQNLLAYHV